MISYEVYKTIHLYSLVTLVFAVTVNCFSPQLKKWARITAMTASLFLLVAGMGLLARTGHPHAEPWPLWVNLKVALWLLLAIAGPILVKRFPDQRPKIAALILTLIALAIFLVEFRHLFP